jgi:hypothetical protein
MQLAGIDRALGFEFSANVAVCPCFHGMSCSLPGGLPDAINPLDPHLGAGAVSPGPT